MNRRRNGQQASRAAPDRFPGLEGLRGLAAAGVLVSHVHLYASPDGGAYDLGPADILPGTAGVAGVVLFFTLSGFLLYRPFAAALLIGRRRPGLRAYLRNRFLRIVPGYWLALLCAGLLLRTAYVQPVLVDGRPLTDEPAVLVANLLLVQGYAPSTLLTGIGPTWSLAVELVFYLSLPLLAVLAGWVATRTGPGRRRPWLAALAPACLLLVLGQLGYLLAAALPAGAGGAWVGSWHAVVSRSFLAQAGLFAGGLALAVLQLQLSAGAVRLPAWWRPLAGSGAVLIAVVAASCLHLYLLPEHYGALLLSVSCVLLLALVVLPREGAGRLTGLLSSRPLQWSGLVSYGVFLWNEPLVWWLRRAGVTAPGLGGFVLALAATALLTAAVAYASWRLVERPVLSLKRPSSGVGTRVGMGAIEPIPTSGGVDRVA